MELGVCLWWWWWRQRCCFFVDDENFIFLFLATAHQFRCLCLSQTIFPPGTIIFPKKRSFHFIWISQNLWGPLIRGGKALIQGQISDPQPFISVPLYIRFSSSRSYMCCLTYFSMVLVDFHGLGAVWLSNDLVNGEYGKMIGNHDDD